MAINKVVYGSNNLIDLSSDTLISPDQLLEGIIAHAANGELITGAMSGGGLDFNPFNLKSYVVGTITPSVDITDSYTITIPYSELGLRDGYYPNSSVVLMLFQPPIYSFSDSNKRRLSVLINFPEFYFTDSRVTASAYRGSSGGMYSDSDKSSCTCTSDRTINELYFTISLNQYSKLAAGDTYTYIVGLP